MVTTAPVSTPVQVAVKGVPLLAGSGSTVQAPIVGAVLSKVKGTLDVEVLPAASAVVAVSSPVTPPGPAVPVQITSPAVSAAQV